MIKKLNNKGYMLVEIILAFAIAFSIVYFIMDLVIRLKSKNDDLMVETLVRTDQTIITNKLMDYAIDEEKEFDCNLLEQGITDTSVTYRNQLIVAVNKYSKIDKSHARCENNNGKVSITIPLKVKQMEDNFDIDIDYKYEIGDMVAPTCSLSVSGTTINASSQDNDGGTGVKYAGWDSTYTGENSTTKTINGTGTYTFYVMDGAGNKESCSATVTGKSSSPYCATPGYTINGGKCTYVAQAHFNGYGASGGCTCSSLSSSNGISNLVFTNCVVSGNTAVCNCPSGFPKVKASNCSIYSKGYYCDSGGALNGDSCTYTEDISYSSTCPDGYTSTGSYCFKAN